MDLSECRILHIRGHVEIYTKQGVFVVSGDTEYEAIDDLKICWQNGQDEK